MFSFSRRHRNRSREHELAANERIQVMAHQDDVLVELNGETDAYVLHMTRDEAEELSAKLTKAYHLRPAEWCYVN